MIQEQESEPKSGKTKKKYEKPVLVELDFTEETDGAKILFDFNESLTIYHPS